MMMTTMVVVPSTAAAAGAASPAAAASTQTGIRIPSKGWKATEVNHNPVHESSKFKDVFSDLDVVLRKYPGIKGEKGDPGQRVRERKMNLRFLQ